MLEAQRRALAAMRAACEHDPAAHAHQLLALEREIVLAGDAADLPSYLGASGSLFEVVRAERLDRAANQLRVAEAVGDRWHAQAAAADHAAALTATGFGDWTQALSVPPPPGAEARGAFTRLMLVAIEQEWTPFPGRSAELAELAERTRQTLLDADPQFDAEAAEFRSRTPWPGPGAPPPRDFPDLEVGAWPPRPGDGPPVPVPVTDAGASYAALAESLPEEDPAREPAAALARAAAGLTPPEAQLRFVTEGLLTDLAAAPSRAGARALLERQAQWPDPLTERHARELLASLDAARTPTEVELVTVHASACLAVESDWNAVLHARLLAPLRAAFAAPGAGDVVVDERAERFLREVAIPLATRAAGAFGAFAGEAGFELVEDLREARRPARVRAMPSATVTLWDQRVGTMDPAAAARPIPAPRPRL